jgi:hypothetical protein
MNNRFSNKTACYTKRSRAVVLTVLLVPFGLVGPSSLSGAEEPKAPGGNRAAAATGITPTATLLRREESGTAWHVVKQNEALPSGDLILGLPGAMLDSKNGGVRAALLTDLGGQSPYPVIECAVRLHGAADVDLDVTLDRGRLDLINRKETGAAYARVHVGKETWHLSLEEPGTRIALELYGRWPRGAAFTPKPGPKDVPTSDLVFLVVRGRVILKHSGCEVTMKAPPGPAILEWDNVSGQDEAPHRLEKLPAWAQVETDDSPVARAKKAALERFHEAILSKSLDAALDQFLNSENPSDRRLAVLALGALDELPRLGKALREAKHPDVWENGVLALRHWIGRQPGQDQLLYQRLLKSGNYTPVQAETVVQLLHSYGDDELARPETYQTLIDYLDHDVIGIRGLAYWHLSRLAPAGKEFGYNPLASKEEREAAVQKWRKLIPRGKVPPRQKAAEDK